MPPGPPWLCWSFPIGSLPAGGSAGLGTPPLRPPPVPAPGLPACRLHSPPRPPGVRSVSSRASFLRTRPTSSANASVGHTNTDTHKHYSSSQGRLQCLPGTVRAPLPSVHRRPPPRAQGTPTAARRTPSHSPVQALALPFVTSRAEFAPRSQPLPVAVTPVSDSHCGTHWATGQCSRHTFSRFTKNPEHVLVGWLGNASPFNFTLKRNHRYG